MLGMLYVLIPGFCVFAFSGFCAGFLARRAWIFLVAAECFAILTVGMFYVIGGSMMQDELSIRRFLPFLISWDYFAAFAVVGLPVLAGRLFRRRTLAGKQITLKFSLGY